MMKLQWEMISAKLEAMTQRERVFIFAAVAVLLLAFINMLLLEPQLLQQKALRGELAQQQKIMSAVQAQIAAMQQENSPGASSPQRLQINQLKQEIAEGEAFLHSSRERLVEPQKMAAHLKQLLGRNARLQLIALQTLPATPLVDQSNEASPQQSGVSTAPMEKQVYKHGVQLTVRGNYLDLLQYLKELEKLPQQMYWAKAQMSVVRYPAAELTLTLYTLSLDRTWLQI